MNARKTGTPDGRAQAARSSAARLAAVQALYQVEMSDLSGDRVLEEFLRHRIDEPLDVEAPEQTVRPRRALLAALVRGVLARRAEIDDLIAATLPPQWPLDRLERVLRAILRCGTYELLARARAPARAVISEYVDVAHAFYAGPEPGMVNGILDRLARALRPGEFEGEPGERKRQAG